MAWKKDISCAFFCFLCLLASFFAMADVPHKVVTMQPIEDDEIVTNTIEYSQDYNTDQEFQCLAKTIYFEARGEGYKGGVAVGNVVMNRVKSRHFPNSICQVMRQKTGKMCQFSFMCNGHINQAVKPKIWQKSQEIAQQIITGQAPKLTKGALFFHADYVKRQAAHKRYTAKIGQHYFYK